MTGVNRPSWSPALKLLLCHRRSERLIEARTLRLRTLQLDLIAELLGAGLSEGTAAKLVKRREKIFDLYSDNFSQIVFGSVPDRTTNSGKSASAQEKASFIAALGKPEGFTDLSELMGRIDEARKSLQGIKNV